MKILYIYRNPNMGISIGKVFKPIEQEMEKYAEVKSIILPCSNYSLTSMWKNIRFTLRSINNTHYDIIHITGTENYLLPFLKNKNVIVTVHDIGSIISQKKALMVYLKKTLFISTLKFAKFVTFISETSQIETLKFVSLLPNRHKVIHNPISNDFPFSAKIFNKENPQILHIGTKQNKNLSNTILAIKDTNYKLTIIGSLTDDQIQLLKENKISYTNKINISDKALYEEYEKCDIVNFPSLYEGFGMPIIEGQSVGRVVVTSNLSPMKEIAGEAAILVNPYDIESIKEGYQRAINNHDVYIKKGLENIKRFQLQDITRQYLNLYKFSS